jgi:hypothetical protein
MSHDVRFITSADSRFFVGAAAMLNSLRLSGNRGAAFVVDAGLRPEQHERLAVAAQVLTVPLALQGLHPLFAKITADLYWSNGVVVLIDSDMIVTSPLDDLIEQAAAGGIAVLPDHEITKDRQLAEWSSTFELQASLRSQRYVNAGLVALSLDHWPSFLGRWRRACDRLPADWPSQEMFAPFGLADQDALNALLMSEIPSDAVWIGPEWRAVHPDGLGDVEVLDAGSLECRYRGVAPILLHYALSPKAWERAGWRRVRGDDAYVRLLPRLLFAGDVPVRARPSEVPMWLRPRGVGRMAAVLVGLLNFVRIDLRVRGMLLRDRLFPRATVSSCVRSERSKRQRVFPRRPRSPRH